MSDRVVFEYVGGGAYRIGLPTRDLRESDMARCAKQGWPRERIEEDLPGIYRKVEAELADDMTADDMTAAEEAEEKAEEEVDAGETLDWDSVEADEVVPTADEPSDTPDEYIIDEEED